LDLWGCDHITDTSLMPLLASNPSLEAMDLSYTDISEQTLKMLECMNLNWKGNLHPLFMEGVQFEMMPTTTTTSLSQIPLPLPSSPFSCSIFKIGII
jgi:hypothetical protein